MTMDSKKDYASNVLRLAIFYGMCKSQSDFADILGVNRSVLSAAMNGNPAYLTDRLVAKIRKFAVEHGIEDEAEGNTPEPAKPVRQITIPEDTLDLYTNLSETCRTLSAIVAAQLGVNVGGMSMADLLAAQKNLPS